VKQPGNGVVDWGQA